MAIFRAETKSLSRAKGHNLAAAISYRAGIKLTDTNKINPEARSYDYTKKPDVVHSEIILPNQLSEQLKARGIELDFQSIADLVEIGETTKRGKMKNSARLAREWVLCGVPELTRAENIELFEQFAQQQSEEQGVLSMVFVHDPTAGDDMANTKAAAEGKKMDAPDPRNIHAHILLLTRKLDVSSNNKLSLGKKSDSEVSNDERTRPVVPKELIGKVDPETGEKIQQGRGLCSNSEWLKNTRKQWADILNERLAQKGVQPVSHQSYKDLGLSFKPTKHLGKDASILERMGIETEIGKYNESVNRYNRSHIEFAADSLTIGTEQKTDDSKRWIDSINSGHVRVQQRIERSKRQVDSGRQDLARAVAEDTEISRFIAPNSRNAEWAIKRTGQIEQIISRSEHRATKIAEQERQVDNLVAEHTRTTTSISPSPNPFDDNARRARATRLAREQGQFDTAAENYDRRTGYYGGTIERARDRSKLVRHEYAKKFLNRNLEDNNLRPGYRESSDYYPDKLDYRQSDVIRDFAQNQGLSKENSEDQREYMRRIFDTFTIGFLEKNKAVMDLLRDPKAERYQYDAIKTDYDTFIKNLDEQRKVIDDKRKYALGDITQVSRMTAESLSAPSYINALDNYINDEATADQNKTLAIKHRADTINRTCEQFKHGMIGLNNIREADKRQTHSEALQVSLNTFRSSYGNELSNDQQKAINVGLSAIKQPVQSNTMRLRR
uniref:MobA/MobL family protein n=1 Tax=Psychrobacter sp. TaxID=56811 RepID=UPI00159AD066|nr:MobA/MobL family protein [Psychrobacter sp.]QJS05212.1 mobilization protein MobA [Psychrobacter sp.]